MKIYYKLLLISLVLFTYTSVGFAAPGKTENKQAESLYQQGKKLYDKKEYDKAFPLLLKAAEMGHSDAQMHVGKMYYNGWGVTHNHAKGKEWHEKAAAQGNKESIKKLKSMDHH